MALSFFMHMNVLLPAALYLFGYWLSFIMLRVEQDSEGEVYTRGDRAVAYSMAILSWLLILLLFARAWIKGIAATGYWSKPVKPVEPSNIVKPKVNEPRTPSTK